MNDPWAASLGGGAFFAILALVLAVGAPGCGDDPAEPEPGPWIAAATPEDLLDAMETIYNDTEHSADERLAEYQKLFLSEGFLFHFQPADYQTNPDIPQTWGRDGEIEAHRALFAAQADSQIYSLRLAITQEAAQTIAGDPERVDWEEIFASHVQLRLLFNPNDGLEVNGGQAEFLFAPDLSKPKAEGARFYGGYWIGDWVDLPRPSPGARPAVEPNTWGSIKANMRGLK